MLKSIALLSERIPNKGKQGSMCTRNLWRWNEDKKRNILQCGVQGNRMVCYNSSAAIGVCTTVIFVQK